MYQFDTIVAFVIAYIGGIKVRHQVVHIRNHAGFKLVDGLFQVLFLILCQLQ